MGWNSVKKKQGIDRNVSIDRTEQGHLLPQEPVSFCCCCCCFGSEVRISFFVGSFLDVFGRFWTFLDVFGRFWTFRRSVCCTSRSCRTWSRCTSTCWAPSTASRWPRRATAATAPRRPSRRPPSTPPSWWAVTPGGILEKPSKTR